VQYADPDAHPDVRVPQYAATHADPDAADADADVRVHADPDADQPDADAD
jgi:hypothetical protein